MSSLTVRRAEDYDLPRIDFFVTVGDVDYIIRFTDAGKLCVFRGNSLLWEK